MDYQLWHGDCLEEMDRIEAGSVDMICADLPYGVTACAFDIPISFEPLWAHYKRVIKGNGAIVLFGSQPFATLLIASSPGFGTKKQWFKYEWIWVNKSRPTNFVHAKNRPLVVHENILVFSGGVTNHANLTDNRMVYFPQMTEGKPYIKRQNPDVQFGTVAGRRPSQKCFVSVNEGTRYPISVLEVNQGNHNSLHPSQKPVALLENIIKTYTNEGDIVLDNTFGSASCGEAALRTGRRFIGIEKDPTYFEIGVARLARVAAELRGELNHLPMFAEAVAV